MKLKDLKSILFSTHGCIQSAIVYDKAKNADIISGCSVDYAVENFGECNYQKSALRLIFEVSYAPTVCGQLVLCEQ